MGENCNWPCWKIMNCDSTQSCPAKSHPETPCWEIASELNDCRRAKGICQDGIVFMLKADKSILSDKEIQSIMNHKTACALA